MSESRIVDILQCPTCGGKDFLRGPVGGLAVNVKCNTCGHVMNITPLPNGKIWITLG